MCWEAARNGRTQPLTMDHCDRPQASVARPGSRAPAQEYTYHRVRVSCVLTPCLCLPADEPLRGIRREGVGGRRLQLGPQFSNVGRKPQPLTGNYVFPMGRASNTTAA